MAHFLIVDIRKRVGTLDTPHYAVQRLKDELDSRDIPCDLYHYDEIDVFWRGNKTQISVKGTPMSEYSHIIMRGHRTQEEYILKRIVVDYAQEHGIKVQNASFVKKLPYYSKLTQMSIQSDNNLPVVDSFYCIDGKYWEKSDTLEKIGFPLIYKHTEGEYRIEMIDGEPKTKKNVFLIENVGELEEACKQWDAPEDTFLLKPSSFFIQKYIDAGEDYRAIMIGGAYVSGWKRTATGSFMTVSKGKYELVDTPDEEFKHLSEQTAKIFEADYCAVDIIYDNGKPFILEVNMNPGFKAFEKKLTGDIPDVAKAIIDNVLS